METETTTATKSIFNTITSTIINACQICHSKKLHRSLFLGYLPPVNLMPNVSALPAEQPAYPAGLLLCEMCGLVQLGLNVDRRILFPQSYPYTSSTTKVLRDNFSELAHECDTLLSLEKEDLVIDIGSNDGNLLSFFKDRHRVLGITPEKIGQLAVAKGIPTIFSYFNVQAVDAILAQYGTAKLVTATNVFAHIENVHEVLNQIKRLLNAEGVFVSESHYFLSLLETLQYDTIYHEHLRYYTVKALKHLFDMHGLEIFHCKRIPTHGGSIRVYVARKGCQKIRSSVQEIFIAEEAENIGVARMQQFEEKVAQSKLDLMAQLADIKRSRQRIFGISAPSRASTLINYCGIDHAILECICETEGSHKINKYVPGTLIPIVNEQRLFDEQPDYALLLSWHIADELMPKLRQKGFKGKFIVPLPEPHIVS